MKLSPERQADYDAMGLPFWRSGPFLIRDCNDKITKSHQDEFIINASNDYHADKQTIEDLTAKLKQSEETADHFRGRAEEFSQKVDILGRALIKLRDCDWTITLPDRMDAVREIAREALKESKETK